MTIKCFSCKYFQQYYIKHPTFFQPLKDGYCLNGNSMANSSRKKFKLKQECEFWEFNADEREENENQIVQVLRETEKHLMEIASLLNMRR